MLLLILYVKGAGGLSLLDSLKGGLIVSCQALSDEPLFGSSIMAALADAAQRGGAVGIRANSPDDIRAIQSKTDLPIIGIWKREYPGSDVYITPTFEDATAVIEAGAPIVAMDATVRDRPFGQSLAQIVTDLKKQSPNILLMADVSTFDEGMHAEQLGFDLISTTLSGYTPYSLQQDEPDVELVRALADRLSVPVLAEGRIQTPEQAVQCLASGAHSIVVGGAITRPQLITAKFVQTIGMRGSVQ